MGNQSKTWIGRRAATLGLLATLIAGVGVGVGGCAVTMSEDEVKAVAATVTLPQLPAPGQAIVYVVRPLLEGFAIPTRVYLDEQTPAANVGYTLGNEHIWFNVSPGRHTIFSKADNWGIIDHIISRNSIPIEGSVFDSDLFELYPKNEVLRINRNMQLTGSDHFPVLGTMIY